MGMRAKLTELDRLEGTGNHQSNGTYSLEQTTETVTGKDDTNQCDMIHGNSTGLEIRILISDVLWFSPGHSNPLPFRTCYPLGCIQNRATRLLCARMAFRHASTTSPILFPHPKQDDFVPPNSFSATFKIPSNMNFCPVSCLPKGAVPPSVRHNSTKSHISFRFASRAG